MRYLTPDLVRAADDALAALDATLEPMMEKFTPGPWSIDPGDEADEFEITAPDDADPTLPWNVALIYPYCGYPKDQSGANATLIAAAPELVEALKAAKELAATMASMTACRSDDEWVWGIQAKIDAALAKAGVSP